MKTDTLTAILTSAFILGLSVIYAANQYAHTYRYSMVGATPRGIVVFDSFTGDAEVRMPLSFPNTSSTQPS